MKKTTKTTIITTKVETYRLTKEIRYCIKKVNGKEKERFLKYVGKKLNGYELIPLYKNKKNMKLLEITNPYWLQTDDWFGYDNLPEPEKVDLSKVFYAQYSTHMFFDLNKKPLPLVYHGDYLEGCLSDEYYDLFKLRNYLKKHKKVISASDILDVPYYNMNDEENLTKYIEVYVLASSEIQQKALNTQHNVKDYVFGTPWSNIKTDYLGIKKFRKKGK